MNKRSRILVFALMALSFASCRKDLDYASVYNGYPVEIGQIMIKNCGTPGCHDQSSKIAEGRFSSTSWEELFQGGSAGSVVIPYSTDYSYLLYFVNTDSSLGLVQEPAMPLNNPSLTREQYIALRDWIAAGAPDINGNVKFADNPLRKKIYVINQGCDNVAILDYETRLIMRNVEVGMIPGAAPAESPHMIKVAPDGNHWYVIFRSGNSYIEEYRTTDDKLTRRIFIGAGDWNTINISPDSKFAYSVAWYSGIISVANLETGIANSISPGTTVHGSGLNPSFTRLYVTMQDGSALFRFDLIDPMVLDAPEFVQLEQTIPNPGPGELLPHEVAFTPDGSKFFVTCQGSSEVRVFDAITEDIIAAIPVGTDPVEMSFSETHKLLFVTCMNDTTISGFPTRRGSVAVIDYETNTLVKSIYAGFQPHGLMVDDARDVVYIANRNISSTGPAPHHSSACGGRNGTLSIIDMNTLELIPDFKAEMGADPYGVAVRF